MPAYFAAIIILALLSHSDSQMPILITIRIRRYYDCWGSLLWPLKTQASNLQKTFRKPITILCTFFYSVFFCFFVSSTTTKKHVMIVLLSFLTISLILVLFQGLEIIVYVFEHSFLCRKAIKLFFGFDTSLLLFF